MPSKQDSKKCGRNTPTPLRAPSERSCGSAWTRSSLIGPARCPLSLACARCRLKKLTFPLGGTSLCARTQVAGLSTPGPIGAGRSGGSGLYNACIAGRVVFYPSSLNAAFALSRPATSCYRSGCRGSFVASGGATRAEHSEHLKRKRVAAVVPQHQRMQPSLCTRLQVLGNLQPHPDRAGPKRHFTPA